MATNLSGNSSSLCDAFNTSVFYGCLSSASSQNSDLLMLFTRPVRTSDTCKSYILLPAENTWSQPLRVVLYGIGLIWCFLGLAAITGVFMKALERIVSTVVEVRRLNPLTGGEQRFYERYWNGTIANLTLLALGTSAPEVYVALIDALKHLGKPPGELGPGTIIGSAAFNLLIILAVCVVAPKPSPTVRRIADYGTFLMELVLSLWAYLWLLLIVKVISPERITIWEAAATLAQFPLFVLLAYGQDQGWAFSWLGRIPNTKNRSTLTHSSSNQSLSQLDSPRSPDPPSTPSSPSVIQNSLHQNLKYRARAVKMVSLGGGGALQQTRDDLDHSWETSVSKSSPQYPKQETPLHWFVRARYGNTQVEAGRELEENPDVLSFTVPGVEVLIEPLYLEVLCLDNFEVPQSEVFLGQLRADLSELVPGERKTVWMELKGKDGKPVERGLVNVSLELVNENNSSPFLLWVEISSGGEGARGESHFMGSLHELLPTVRQQAVARSTQRQRTLGRLKKQWALQLYDAMTAGAREDEEPDEDPSALNLLLHFCAFYWKLLFAFIPPPSLWGGWPAFITCLVLLGGITALVEEFALLFACASGLDTFLTAVTFVAVGTSLPELLASKIATEHSQDADSAIANINGSNCVNVFLGIGLPWLITAVYDHMNGESLKLPDAADKYVVSLIAFFVTASISIGLLVLRRHVFGGELGGNRIAAVITSILLCLLWVGYVVFSALEAYNIL